LWSLSAFACAVLATNILAKNYKCDNMKSVNAELEIAAHATITGKQVSKPATQLIGPML